MTNRFSFFYLILFIPAFLTAQTAVEDSLTSVLLNSKEDTTKVKSYYELFKIVRKYDTKRASELAMKQLTLSEKLGYKWGIGKAYMGIGNIATSLSQGNLALENFRKCIEPFQSINDFGSLSPVYSNISLLFTQGILNVKYDLKTLCDSAIYYARIAQKYNSRIKSDTLKYLNNEMFIYGSFCSAYFNLNLHDSAILYNNRSIELAEKLNRYDIAAGCYNALAVILSLQKNYDKTIEYLLKAYKIYEREKMFGFAHIAISDLASTYFSKGDIKKSKEYIDASMKYVVLYSDSGRLPQDYCTLGLIALSENNINDAIHQFEKGIEINKRIKNKGVESQLWMHCAEAYAKNKNFKKALLMYDKALELSAGDYKATYDCYNALSSIHASLKNYEKAFKFQNEARILNDRLFDSTKSQIINELTVKYETGKKDNEIVLLNKERDVQLAEVGRQKAIKTSLALAGLTVVIFSVAGFVIYKRRRDANLKKKEAELNAHIVEVEMKALRSQMNPHFIFNSLRSINEYIQHNQSTLASEYLVKFAKLMRAILENSRKKEISISDDLEVLELYMQLESQRMNHPFKYSIEIDPEIDPLNVLIPPMLLQPIVENSIWHGIAPKDQSGKIIIRIKKIDELIQCEVEDDGVGRRISASTKNDEIRKPESFGLKITEERLEIIGELKKIKTNLMFNDLLVDKKLSGLCVYFKLPYELSI